MAGGVWTIEHSMIDGGHTYTRSVEYRSATLTPPRKITRNETAPSGRSIDWNFLVPPSNAGSQLALSTLLISQKTQEAASRTAIEGLWRQRIA